MAKVSALAGKRHGWLPKQHAQLGLEALHVDGRVRGQCLVLAPLLGQGVGVEARVSSKVLEEFVQVFLGQFSQRVDDEFGTGEVFGVRGSDARSIALGACIACGCEARLCTATLALSIVVAFSLVNGSTGRADGSAAITLLG